MPEPKVHCKFEVDPKYDEAKALSESISDVRVYLQKELACIDTIEDITLQAICLFAMLDCLAQEQANYPSDSKTAFCQFVLKHQKQCDYMESVEPITLYYHVEDLIEKEEPLPEFPPEKVVSIEDLGYLYGVKMESLLAKGKSGNLQLHVEANCKFNQFHDKPKCEGAIPHPQVRKRFHSEEGIHYFFWVITT